MDYKQYFITDNINGVRCREKWLINNNIDLYNKIIDYCSNIGFSDEKFLIKLWLFINNADNLPKCECGSETKYITLEKGFREFCSIKCLSNSEQTKNKKKATNIIKYGFESPLKNKLIKAKQESTMIEKYGVDNPSKLEEFKEKKKKTTLKNFGVDNPSKSKDIQETKINNYIRKYGVSNHMKNIDFKRSYFDKIFTKYGTNCTLTLEENKLKRDETWFNKYGVLHPKSSKDLQIKNIQKRVSMYKQGYVLNDLDVDNFYMFCNKCSNDFIISRELYYSRISDDGDICTNCNPKNSFSKTETELVDFVIEAKTLISLNDRNIIKPLEIDLYLPEYNLGFEFNGLYWHSDKYKMNDYHLNKTEACEAKGLQLIHIFEDEWLFKKDIVKSRILNILGLTHNKIYARKCIIKEVPYKESKEFLEANHIQGNVNSSHRLGLYYNDELVSIMTFGALRKNLGQTAKEGSFELLRFCNKLNTNVIGGASKLFKYFITNFEYNEIISYADRRWSKGDLYDKLGFDFIHNSKPNYYYTKGRLRENRFKYRKSELVKQGFDPNKTEKEIMTERGFGRIYDCGSKKYIYKNNG